MAFNAEADGKHKNHLPIQKHTEPLTEALPHLHLHAGHHHIWQITLR